jgi:hypothetical protein
LLVATEETGTDLRRQHRQMAPRAAELMQPAGGQVRIGVLQDHEHNFPLLDSNWKTARPEPPKKALKSHEGIGLLGNKLGVGEVSIVPKGAEERTRLQFRVSAEGTTSSE